MEESKVLWGGPEDEGLSHHTMDDYVKSYLGEFDRWSEEGEKPPQEIIAVRYERDEFGFRADRMLENLLESLDDEYAGDDMTDPTPAMAAAAEAFMDVIKQEYRVWRCHEVGRVTVDVAEWLAAHPKTLSEAQP